MTTNSDILHRILNRLAVESITINGELQELEKRAAELRERLTEIDLEYRVLQGMDEEETTTVTETTTTTTVTRTRRRHADKIKFEETLKRIFNEVGRPMTMKELLYRLEAHEWKWNSDNAAYVYINSCDVVERVSGVRGMYQLRR